MESDRPLRRRTDRPSDISDATEMILTRMDMQRDHTDLQIDLMKREIIGSLPEMLDSHFDRHIGSSQRQHAAEHEQLRQMAKVFSTVRKTIVTAMAGALFVVAASYASGPNIKVSIPAALPSSQERYMAKTPKVDNDDQSR